MLILQSALRIQGLDWEAGSQLTTFPPAASGIKIFASYLLLPDCFYAWRACRELCLKCVGPSEQPAQRGTMGGAGGTGGNLAFFSQHPAQQARFEAPVLNQAGQVPTLCSVSF